MTLFLVPISNLPLPQRPSTGPWKKIEELHPGKLPRRMRDVSLFTGGFYAISCSAISSNLVFQ